MNNSANFFVQREGSLFSDANTGVTLRKHVTNSRDASVFTGDHLPNGTHLQHRGQQQVARDGKIWLFVGYRGQFGWIRKDHTVVVMLVHRSGSATHSDLRRCPSNANTGFKGSVADGSLVEVIGQTHNDGFDWANVREPITGEHGWIKVLHLQSAAGHAVGGAHRHAVGGARHHAVGGARHHAVGGACPLTQQAAIRAALHQPTLQQDMALAQQQMQGFRQQQAQAEAMARAQAQARGMQMLGALGLPFGLHFMGM